VDERRLHRTLPRPDGGRATVITPPLLVEVCGLGGIQSSPSSTQRRASRARGTTTTKRVRRVTNLSAVDGLTSGHAATPRRAGSERSSMKRLLASGSRCSVRRRFFGGPGDRGSG
jgi:hypothetical protein